MKEFTGANLVFIFVGGGGWAIGTDRVHGEFSTIPCLAIAGSVIKAHGKLTLGRDASKLLQSGTQLLTAGCSSHAKASSCSGPGTGSGYGERSWGSTVDNLTIWNPGLGLPNLRLAMNPGSLLGEFNDCPYWLVELRD
jgi:hypothetical protein